MAELVAKIAPWLTVANAAQAVAHYQAAFGAVVLERVDDGAGGIVVARLAIGGAELWVQADEPSSPPAAAGQRASVRLILNVDDPDALFARAVAAGATVVAPIHEAHGWRVGRVADPSGLHWEIGKELRRR